MAGCWLRRRGGRLLWSMNPDPQAESQPTDDHVDEIVVLEKPDWISKIVIKPGTAKPQAGGEDAVPVS